ncbi:NAD(P)-dependent oxidoreductase [Pseudonocardia kunmingensis]|uniref:3-hydroxyisobutyrate dehydrogenase-like beta-hydroxyacid dehydrogenase n=1 Tax=Pseudonocardia kunmingensis TaxID=630975 RepID=A0A543DKX9_9PSEU|nr:NAD(P)-binding domain-containing protein [Pseudonocardia kunmingensis]TQM09994.1 3-hydroxyisobutyrate dehydrogenase-like beta-hydroxyacid dehydrogenase [Pseudonocardia kunmingensis]
MTDQQTHTDVTVIGLGPMGSALAQAFLAADRTLTVWNRTPGRADDLVAGGAHRAGTVAEAVTRSPVTITCLNDYTTLHQVLDSVDGPLRGRTLVNLGSGTPAEARAAADRAAGRGLDHLDGAIMVPPPLVRHPESVFLYSGPQDVFDRHRATLATLGDPRHLGADPGLAVLFNTALLGMMYATLNGFLHAAALARSAGVPVPEFAELALGWFMPAVLDPAGIAEQAPDMEAGTYPGDLGTMRMNRDALEHITRTSVEQGVHSELPRLMADLAERAVAQGHGDENYFAMFEVFANRGRR